MTTVDLPIPPLLGRATPTDPPTTATAHPLPVRRPTRQIHVGPVPVCGSARITVQTMTTTLTADVDATLQQIAEVTAAGCDIIRVAVPSQDDADALPRIVERSPIPVIADIHFQPRYVFQAIDAGCVAVRVNPGNIKKFDDRIAEILQSLGSPGAAGTTPPFTTDRGTDQARGAQGPPRAVSA